MNIMKSFECSMGLLYKKKDQRGLLIRAVPVPVPVSARCISYVHVLQLRSRTAAAHATATEQRALILDLCVAACHTDDLPLRPNPSVLSLISRIGEIDCAAREGDRSAIHNT
jgi:hypothetical protein